MNLRILLFLISLRLRDGLQVSIKIKKPYQVNSSHQSVSSRLECSTSVESDIPITKIYKKNVDSHAIANYLGATSLQFGLITSFLYWTDKFIQYMVQVGQKSYITPLVTLIMIMMSLRSRWFSPLDNSRPKALESDPVFKRNRPKWQPPPIVFPIVWSTIAVLRVLSGVMAYQAVGSLSSVPILSFMLHLSIGDTWNTINNVENKVSNSFNLNNYMIYM
jgi:tryptophan-rich sensory protein